MKGRWSQLAGVGLGGIMLVHCGADHAVPATSSDEASAASARVAELRARFGLPDPSVERFDVLGPRAFAVIPESRRGTRPARVGLPLRANREVEIEDEASHVAVRFALQGTSEAKMTAGGGMALYAGALDGADVVHRVFGEGTEDFVAFERRPTHEQLRYAVDVSRVAGLRLVSRTLEFLDDSGTPVLRVNPPYVVDAGGARHAAELAVAGCAFDASPVAPWGRPVTPPGASRCTVIVSWHDVSYPAMVDPAWTTTGSLVTPRFKHTATRLASGRVLFTSGTSYPMNDPVAAEIYDPAGAGSFAATGMPVSFVFESRQAVLLKSGKVLVVGGMGTYNGAPMLARPFAVAELYDATTGQFTATGPMAHPRYAFTATMLPSGKVLVAGGSTTTSATEIFDPAGNDGAGSFAPGPTMLFPRLQHAATALANGKVLLSGGVQGSGATAEVFDPAANAGAGALRGIGMGVKREGHTATLLPSGKVLVAGGIGLKSVEVYEPLGNDGAGSFSPCGPMSDMAQVRVGHAASILPSGLVLVTGSNPPEIYDPSGNAGAGGFRTAAPMGTGRAYHSATPLLSGRLLIAGGASTSAEIYGGAVGDGCTVTTSCLTGTCVDGVCCATACAGPCESCLAAKKQDASADGVCGPAKQGTACGEAACSATKRTAKSCDAAGACQTTTAECAPYTCADAACTTKCATDATCAATAWCDDGLCRAKLPDGAACAASRVCTGGHCVDGACSDQPAGGPSPLDPTGSPPPRSDALTAGGGGCNVASAPSGAPAWLAMLASTAWLVTRRRREARA